MIGSAVLARIARNNFKKFIQGKTSSRIPPPLFFAIMAYLEFELKESNHLGSLDAINGDENFSKGIRSKYVSAMSDILLKGTRVEENPSLDESSKLNLIYQRGGSVSNILNGSAHGSMYHLGMLAYYTATKEVRGMEKFRYVSFFNSNSELQSNMPKKTYRRYVDLVIGELVENEQWIELKSLKRKKISDPYKASEGFKTWGGKKAHGYSKSTYHKQFSLDRAALQQVRARLPENAGNRPVSVTDICWWFHQFEVKKSSPSIHHKSIEVGSVGVAGTPKERLSSLMKSNANSVFSNETIRFTLNTSIAGKQTAQERLAISKKIKGFNFITLLKQQLKSKGFLTVELESVIDDYLNGSAI